MSAEVNTEISITGTADEITAILGVLRMYETERYQQYQSTRQCAYISGVRITGTESKQYLKDMTDEEVRRAASEYKNLLLVEASGPYGYYSTLEEVGLFEDMAEAAPRASFSGSSEGYITGASVALNGELREGLLQISHYYEAEEEWDEGYIEEIVRRVPYHRFTELFKINATEFDKDDYEDFIANIMSEKTFPEMKYKRFKKYCRESKVDNEGYEGAIEILKAKGVVDFDTYRSLTEDERWDPERNYDPVAKRYIEK